MAATMWEMQVAGLVERTRMEMAEYGGMDLGDHGRAVREPFCMNCERWVDAGAVRHHEEFGHVVDAGRGE